MQVITLSPYQNFVYALKSKDVKRQYPAMLSRFLKVINRDGDSTEEQCVSLCECHKSRKVFLYF